MQNALAPSTSRSPARCPRCRNSATSVLLPARDIQRELELRREFTRKRFGNFTTAKSIKDLDDVTHSDAAELMICRSCDIVIRDDAIDPAVYEIEEYDGHSLETIFDAHLRDFEEIAPGLRDLLARGANAVEVGSYTGAFLAFAKTLGWNIVGIDPGLATSQFANRRGLPTLRCTLEEATFPDASLDAVFVWNCFEQLDDPESLVRESLRILKRHGLLVIRTPHAGFHRLCRDLVRSDASLNDPPVRLLAWSNLLGFPYRFGFTPQSLRRIVDGFTERSTVSRFPSFFPRPHASQTAIDEESATRALAKDIRRITGLAPWFESIFEKK